ncbi:glycosyltransferase family 87 protein [Vallicoccus soli]|uniref:glycosyltransferase family 87 protein n=1 Tax=Vallicoccus soli TaxID=2339232 RepID=UPI001C498FFB|nr:glycosyltransferase 87 family protein [Vallicoccus soli]
MRGNEEGAPDRVLPSREDPVARATSEVLGGPLGPRALAGVSAARALPVLLALTTLAMVLAVLVKQHCRTQGWDAPGQFVHLCYSDLPSLFFFRDIGSGAVPYLSDVPPDAVVEYPVLTGLVMWVTALLVPGSGETAERALTYFDVNVVGLAACALVLVWATAVTARRRPWDALLVAVSPSLVLAATVNWDLWAVALLALSMLAWARERPVLAGVLLGLATAAKFYPLLVLGPLLVLCLRAGLLRTWWRTLGAAVLAWLAVNVPVALAAPEEWARFYLFSRERGAGFSSVWYVMYQQGVGVPTVSALNLLATGLLVACCAGVAWLAVAAPRRPRLAQLAFLVVAAFLLTNKVYSPQYVLWLLPLAALARPVWRDHLVWTAGEVVHFVGIWLFLAGFPNDGDPDRALPEGPYGVTVLLHVAGTLWLVALVVRDVLHPEHDPVRASGDDDPHGGPLDGAPDRLVLGPARRAARARHAAPAVRP